MSKLTDFISQWNGKYLKVLNPGLQCFDVAAKWCDILSIPDYPNNPSPFPYMNAYEIYTKYSAWHAPYFDRIKNEVDNKPQEGDIVVWDGGYNGGVGHVAVATGKANYSSFIAFSQNDPLNSPCILKIYNYHHVLGWLRPKNYQLQQPMNNDRRLYWFDLMNSVTFKKPHEQVTDQEVQEFVKEYPNQKDGNGKWSQVCNQVFKANIDSNKVTVAQFMSQVAQLNGGYTQADLDKAKHDERVSLIKKMTDWLATL